MLSGIEDEEVLVAPTWNVELLDGYGGMVDAIGNV